MATKSMQPLVALIALAMLAVAVTEASAIPDNQGNRGPCDGPECNSMCNDKDCARGRSQFGGSSGRMGGGSPSGRYDNGNRQGPMGSQDGRRNMQGGNQRDGPMGRHGDTNSDGSRTRSCDAERCTMFCTEFRNCSSGSCPADGGRCQCNDCSDGENSFGPMGGRRGGPMGEHRGGPMGRGMGRSDRLCDAERCSMVCTEFRNCSSGSCLADGGRCQCNDCSDGENSFGPMGGHRGGAMGRGMGRENQPCNAERCSMLCTEFRNCTSGSCPTDGGRCECSECADGDRGYGPMGRQRGGRFGQGFGGEDRQCDSERCSRFCTSIKNCSSGSCPADGGRCECQECPNSGSEGSKDGFRRNGGGRMGGQGEGRGWRNGGRA